MYSKQPSGKWSYDDLFIKPTPTIKRTKHVDVEVLDVDDNDTDDLSFDQPQSDEGTTDPFIGHYISMLQTLLEYRLHMDISNIDWSAMSIDDVKSLTHQANMMLVESGLSQIRKRKSIK